MRRQFIAFAVLLSLTFACGARQVQVAVDTGDTILAALVRGTKTARIYVTEAANAGDISQSLRNDVLYILRDINVSGKEAAVALGEIAALSPDDRTQVLRVLLPVINQLDEVVIKMNLIKDDHTREMVVGALKVLQSTLNSIASSLITGDTEDVYSSDNGSVASRDSRRD